MRLLRESFGEHRTVPVPDVTTEAHRFPVWNRRSTIARGYQSWTNTPPRHATLTTTAEFSEIETDHGSRPRKRNAIVAIFHVRVHTASAFGPSEIDIGLYHEFLENLTRTNSRVGGRAGKAGARMAGRVLPAGRNLHPRQKHLISWCPNEIQWRFKRDARRGRRGNAGFSRTGRKGMRGRLEHGAFDTWQPMPLRQLC